MKYLTILSVIQLFSALSEALNKKFNAEISLKWNEYLVKNHIQFQNKEEEIEALNNFIRADEEIENFNNNEKNSFKIGHNEFSHWSAKDHQKHKGLIPLPNTHKRDLLPGFGNFQGQNHSFQMFVASPNYIPPESVDWVKSGWNTSARNQLNCQDCWAFAATGALEAALWIKHKLSVSLSPQQLTDCSFNYGNKGCDGGVVAFSLGYINDVGLIEEEFYPFIGKLSSCNISGVNLSKTYKISKYYMIQPYSDAALMEALAKFGPIAVSIDTKSPISWPYSFRNYNSGIYADSIGFCNRNIGKKILIFDNLPCYHAYID